MTSGADSVVIPDCITRDTHGIRLRAYARPVDVVVTASRRGLITPAGMMTWPDAAAWLAASGRDTRLVWPSAATAYPPLLRSGARVARCHDLRLSAAILTRAVPGASPAPAWLLEPPGEPGEATLLDDLTDDDAPGHAQVSAEWERQQQQVSTAPAAGRLRLLLAAESAGALIAAEMRADGLPWSRRRHTAILTEVLGERPAPGFRPMVMERLAIEIADGLGVRHVNPDSPAELLRTLRAAGLAVTSTSKWDLQSIDHPVIAPLLEYKRLARLLTANGWTWLDTWVEPGVGGRADRFRTDYVPGGVVTGRWATSGGGALQIPKLLRAAVSADPGWCLVRADAAQIEPRVLAAMSADEALARAGADRDLYAGLVESGVVDTRARAKVGMLGALYGGTTGESATVLPALRRAYPRALGFVDAAARAGERGATVHTWLGRTSPRPSQAAGTEDEQRARSRAWGRFTRNFVVQGTAAEWALCWMAHLRNRLRELSPTPGASPTDPGQGRPHLVYFLHDEIIVHTPQALADDVATTITDSAREAGRLLFGDFPITFPLEVS